MNENTVENNRNNKENQEKQRPQRNTNDQRDDNRRRDYRGGNRGRRNYHDKRKNLEILKDIKGDLQEEEIKELENLETNDDGFKDEELQKNKKAGSPIAPLGGGDAYYFDYDDEYPQIDEVIAIQFQDVGKIYWYYYPDIKNETNDISPGDFIVAFSERGVEIAKVLEKSEDEFKKQDKINFIKNGFIRKAEDKDFTRQQRLKEKAENSKEICKRINEELDINMKLIRVKHTLDDSKVIFYFTANGRVDFRELIKRLASNLKRRIEMRQIGVRDTTKMLGGLGPCGMDLCCARFLHSFAPVSIKMAKDQNLTLNPNKISGICGRLFCCLSYEDDCYQKLRKKYPAEETPIYDHNTSRKGFVKKINVIQKSITVELEPEKDSRRSEEKTYDAKLIDRKKDGSYAIRIQQIEEDPDLSNISPIIPVEKELLGNTQKKRTDDKKLESKDSRCGSRRPSNRRRGSNRNAKKSADQNKRGNNRNQKNSASRKSSNQNIPKDRDKSQQINDNKPEKKVFKKKRS